MGEFCVKNDMAYSEVWSRDDAPTGSATLELIRRAVPARAVRVAAALLLWTLIALGSATHWWLFPQGQYPYTWWELVAAKCGVWYLWGALVPVIFMIAARFRLDRAFRWRHLAILLLLGTALTLTYSVGYTLVILAVINEPGSFGFGEMLDFVMTMHSTWYFLAFWVVVGIEHGALYYRRLLKRERLEGQLRRQLAKAQLEQLKGRLHPHFLFNTLNAISALVLSDRKAPAYEALVDLASLLRLSLDRSEAQFVRLADELEFTRLYLSLMARRYPESMAAQVSVDAALETAMVPSLILQPLVENAVKYGIADGAGWVRITGHRTDEWLYLEVSNSVSAATAGLTEGCGRGLADLRERLAYLYEGRQNLLTVESDPTEYRVQLKIPYSMTREASDYGGEAARANARAHR